MFKKQTLLIFTLLSFQILHAFNRTQIIISLGSLTGFSYILHDTYNQYQETLERKSKKNRDDTKESFIQFLQSNDSCKKNTVLWSILSLGGLWALSDTSNNSSHTNAIPSNEDPVPKGGGTNTEIPKQSNKKSTPQNSNPAILETTEYKKTRATILNAAIGDALGRITEFTKTNTQNITKLEQAYHQIHGCTPYTDDTVLAQVVLEECQTDGTEEEIIDRIARRIAAIVGPEKNIIDPLFNLRAHGIGVQNEGKKLLSFIQNKEDILPGWWRKRDEALSTQQKKSKAGCGTVMRAWPIGLLFSDIEKIIRLARDQSILTHSHPMAHAASASLAVGIYYARTGSSVEEVIEKIIETAERFDEEEKAFKPGAVKIIEDTDLNKELLKQSKLLTSDLIRFAYKQALEKKEPAEVLGTHDEETDHRSTDGFLRGWCADEAIASAVYLFARNKSNIQDAMSEAVNTPGDSDSIATLTGALIGAYSGNVYEDENLNYLENKDLFEEKAVEIATSIVG